VADYPIVRWQNWAHIDSMTPAAARKALPKFAKLDQVMLSKVVLLFAPSQIGKKNQWHRDDFNKAGDIR
jgi:hypothetical protein